MVVRSGSNFSGYTSSDGVNWVQVGDTSSNHDDDERLHWIGAKQRHQHKLGDGYF